MRPRVLVTLKIPPEHLAPLDGVAEIDMSPHPLAAMPRAEALEKARGCAGLICQGELRIDDAMTKGPRIHSRMGGLESWQVKGEDGLR